MWKVIYESVAGVAHGRRPEACQDGACAAVVKARGGEPVLVVACADGAGSAALGRDGARVAVEALVDLVRGDLERGLAVRAIELAHMLAWYRGARARLEAAAARRGAGLRDLACTALAAVVGPGESAFGQVGDGAIVALDGDAYRPVFWPQTGEYANATNFLTGDGFERALAFAALDHEVDELAVFTDGLQTLALRLAEHRAHGPFFEPLFRTLRAAADVEALRDPLRAFLDSPRVNERTDDDKTLVLATRLPP